MTHESHCKNQEQRNSMNNFFFLKILLFPPAGNEMRFDLEKTHLKLILRFVQNRGGEQITERL